MNQSTSSKALLVPACMKMQNIRHGIRAPAVRVLATCVPSMPALKRSAVALASVKPDVRAFGTKLRRQKPRIITLSTSHAFRHLIRTCATSPTADAAQTVQQKDERIPVTVRGCSSHRQILSWKTLLGQFQQSIAMPTHLLFLTLQVITGFLGSGKTVSASIMDHHAYTVQLPIKARALPGTMHATLHLAHMRPCVYVILYRIFLCRPC